jgi:DNA-binding NarL/FixJ family response regulator
LARRLAGAIIVNVTSATSDPIADGYGALAAGNWDVARESFDAALTEEESAESLDGLAQALWWLNRVDEAVAHRERAYSAFKRRGDVRRAARVALWLSREYAALYGNDPAANGWLARAEGLVGGDATLAEHGLVQLVRAERATDPVEAIRLATEALELARRLGDGDLEVAALAEVGLAEVKLGELPDGMTRLDEALAAATAGEALDLQTVGNVCCKLVVACELAGDAERFAQWGKVVEPFMRRHAHVPLLAFCAVCCAELLVSAGRIADAERELLRALQTAEEAGHHARCVEPGARLAELRVLQGRFEDAEALLAGFTDGPEVVRAKVRLLLARGEYAAASSLLQRRLRTLGDSSPLAASLLELLVQAQLARGELAAARRSASRLEALAEKFGQERIAAQAELVTGKVLVAAGEAEGAARLERALERYSRLGLPLEVARVRLELARALESSDREAAIQEARAAAAGFERLGAGRDRDRAAFLLRRLGGEGRTGPRDGGTLTRREQEVLRLLALGLTNGEIATRLFITPKTAGNHVSSIFMKLGVRNRAQAAAFAQRNAPEGSATE